MGHSLLMPREQAKPGRPGLARIEPSLAAFEFGQDSYEFGEVFSASARHAVGVTPVAARKARLNGPSDP